MILISSLRKNDLVEHPKGGTCFGVIPSIPQHGIKRGGIYLRKGDHAARFGVDHIWQAHEHDLRKLGYLIEEDVAAYVAKIIEAGTPIFYDKRDGPKVQIGTEAEATAPTAPRSSPRKDIRIDIRIK